MPALSYSNIPLLTQQYLGEQVGFSMESPSCPNAQVSCQNTSIVQDLCCFNAPGGQILQTQFWDTHPPTGTSDAWTLHGLWPDHCDGSFDQYCDDSRSYNNITEILESFQADDLLKTMGLVWKDFQNHDANLWKHEWAKHGTCISTLQPSCYSDYVPQSEVLQYFETAVRVYQTLPSYQWLSNAGIVPSKSASYSRDDVQAALQSQHGFPVTLRCRSGQLDEIWYHFGVKGSLQSGVFLPASPDGTKSNCPARVKYLPKSTNPHASSRTRSKPDTNAPKKHHWRPGRPYRGHGFLNVRHPGQNPNSKKNFDGCVQETGQWIRGVNCAAFEAFQQNNGFTLRSMDGKCALGADGLDCGAHVRDPTVFGHNGMALSVDGSDVWYADRVPPEHRQVNVQATGQEGMVPLKLVWYEEPYQKQDW